MGGAGGGEGPAEPLPGGAGAETKPRHQRLASGSGWPPARPASTSCKEDSVRWIPALDVNRVVLGMQVVAIVLLLTIRSIAQGRAAHA